MSDLIKRLREGAHFYHAPTTWNEAADRIEADAERIAELEREKAKLEWALKQIADLDPKTGSIGTAVMIARESRRTPAHPPAGSLTNEGTSAENFPDVSLIDEGSKIPSSGAAKEK